MVRLETREMGGTGLSGTQLGQVLMGGDGGLVVEMQRGVRHRGGGQGQRGGGSRVGTFSLVGTCPGLSHMFRRLRFLSKETG